MAMENPFEGKEIWFGVGSQDLYGEEALRQVAQQTGEMVDFLNATGKIPAKIVLKPTLKSSDGVKAFMTEASANPNVIGVITWCHTFSPAKMWIRGLEVLTKPLLQLATQHHREIPWETIDMDFMNLNQAAHGDREFGYIVSRLGIPRKIVVGHYTDPEVAGKVGTWARACAGWDASQNMKVMRWGDNMRNVAVTEGDKTEAERDQAFGRGEHVLVEFAGRHLGPLARSGFAFRDHGVFAGALDAFGKQGVDGFVVAYFDGCARGRVLGEHEVFSFLAFPRFSWVLRYMRSLRLR